MRAERRHNLVTKTLLLIPTLDRSGAEKQFSLLAEGLQQRGFETRAVALTRGGPYAAVLDYAGIPLTILGKRGKFSPSTLSRLRRIIKEWEPDLLFSSLFAANAYGRLATWGLSRPRIVISERCVDTWKSGWQHWLDRRLASRTACLVANSQSVADFYLERGFAAERVEVIPNAVSVVPHPTLSRSQFLKSIDVPDDAYVVMYSGRLAAQKRLGDLLWAEQLLRQVEPRAYFLVIGEGPERGELELRARDLECDSHVRFLGHRDDAASLLHFCDVFWLASEFEGMSNSLMEAMMCGKPVVVSGIPPNRELVTHGEQGWVVDLGDSAGFSQFTLRLLNDRESRERMGAAGQQRMESEFGVQPMLDRYVDLFRRIAPAATS